MPRILRLDRRKRWGAAMLVNTVPAPVVTGAIIRELPRDAYIFRHRVQTGRYGFRLRQRVRHPCGSGTWTSGKICAEGERLYSGPGGGEIRAKGA